MDEDYLLWFHHLPWDWRTRSGRSLWAELVHRYDRGVAAVDAMAATWDAQRAHVDAERFADVRSEEHTSELQSLMRISYAVFCLKKKKRAAQDQPKLHNPTPT